MSTLLILLSENYRPSTPLFEGDQIGSPVTIDRTRAAAYLINQGFAQDIIVCGGPIAGPLHPPVSHAMRDYLQSQIHVPANIYVEGTSFDTVDNAIGAKQIFDSQIGKPDINIGLITSITHMPAAILIFSRVFTRKINPLPMNAILRLGGQEPFFSLSEELKSRLIFESIRYGILRMLNLERYYKVTHSITKKRSSNL